MTDQRTNALIHEALANKYSRRQVVQRALALGLSLPAISAILAACGDDDDDDESTGSDSPTATVEEMEDVTETAAEPEEAEDTPAAEDRTEEDGTEEEAPADDTPVAEADGAWNQAPEAEKPSQLSFIYWPWGTTEEEIVTRFESDWGVQVEQLAEANIEPLFNKVNTMYATGQQLDVIKTLINWMSQWITNGVIRSIDDMPGLEAYKQDMNQLCLQAVEWEGQTWGLPYYQSFFMAAYFEDHFAEAGIENPPTTYDELVEQALQIKEAGIAEYPILWMAAQGGEHVTFEFFNLVHNWGGTVFDADKQPTLGEGSVAREALAWWQRTFLEWEISAPESLELRFIPAAQAMGTGKYTYHLFTHHYYFLNMNGEESPVAGRIRPWILPNDGATLGWTALETMSGTTNSPEWAWMLLQYVGGKTQDGEYTIAKRYAIESMLGSGYDVVNRDPEVMEAWSKWTDVELTLQQWELATSTHIAVPAMSEPWFQQWQDSAQISIQNCLLGQITPDEACEEMISSYETISR